MTLLSRSIGRWRRSRGFGVHSPFAFRFITMVLRSRDAYYCYPQLEVMPDPEWHKLLFRLVCEFQPSCIEAIRLTDGERKAIELADSRAEVVTGVLDSYSSDIRLFGHGTEVLIERNVAGQDGRWTSLLASMTAGMTFTNGRTGIAVVRHDLPRQDFDISF